MISARIRYSMEDHVVSLHYPLGDECNLCSLVEMELKMMMRCYWMILTIDLGCSFVDCL